ncbi:hypothetical protein [Candidatus Spongiihabitans sp.]|uniref:hypothetical protein n=1 Tax=Candidatus Spongiihabitans sp. TaxID=3101308 RepID=UPI003C7B4F32
MPGASICQNRKPKASASLAVGQGQQLRRWVFSLDYRVKPDNDGRAGIQAAALPAQTEAARP